MQIVVDEGGSVEFTRKPHLLELLHPNDLKRVERMTDIQFDILVQKYYIKFLRGPFADYILRWEASRGLRVGDMVLDVDLAIARSLADLFKLYYKEYVGGHLSGAKAGGTGTVFFDTYEQAVECEVSFVEFLRDQGYSMK